MRLPIFAFALLALGIPACAAPSDEDGGESADAVVGLPSEENAAAKAWNRYAAEAIAQAEKDYAHEKSQIVAVSLSSIPSAVLSRYSRQDVEVAAFFLWTPKDNGDNGDGTYKYAVLQVSPRVKTGPSIKRPSDNAETRIVFVARGIDAYAGRELGSCVGASGKPLSKCVPAPWGLAR